MARAINLSRGEEKPDPFLAKLATGGAMPVTVSIAIVGIFIIALLSAFYMSRYILAPVVAGLLVGMMIAPLARRLTSARLSTFAASSLVVAGLMIVVALAVTSLAVPLDNWSSRIPTVSERLVTKWNEISKPIKQLKEVEKRVDTASKDQSGPMEVVVKPRGIVSNMITSAPDVIARLLLFFGTIYFFLGTRVHLIRKTLASIRDPAARSATVRMFRDVQQSLARYFATTCAVNATFGLVVGIAMYLIGLPSPHLWGALAMLLNFAPFIGPAVMAFILLGVSIATFTETGDIILAPAIFVMLNLIEGQFVTPRVLGRALTLNSLLVFLMIAFWLWLWGPVGAFLAVPMLIVLTVSYERYVLGNKPGLEPKRP